MIQLPASARSCLRIATRGSQLALWQAQHVADLLTQQEPTLSVELVVLTTQGDRIQDRPLAELGGKGLFTKEIEQALLDGSADIAVHSMKDLPAQQPDGLILAAVPTRADVSDALIVRSALRPQGLSSPTTARQILNSLPPGARVGTSSVRRQSQLAALCPGIQLVALRGNVDTRLRKLDAGELDAIVLASAGLSRLGLSERITARFLPTELVPACGQGALALQCRDSDGDTQARLGYLHVQRDALVVQAERAVNEQLGGNCHTPLGAYGVWAGRGSDVLTLTGLLSSLDGSRRVTATLSSTVGTVYEATALGQELACELLQKGGGSLLVSTDD